MEKICPLCNGMVDVARKCPYCGNLLQDGGVVENYYGPYSPYVGEQLTNRCHDGMHDCVHLLYCAACHYDVRGEWSLVSM